MAKKQVFNTEVEELKHKQTLKVRKSFLKRFKSKGLDFANNFIIYLETNKIISLHEDVNGLTREEVVALAEEAKSEYLTYLKLKS